MLITWTLSASYSEDYIKKEEQDMEHKWITRCISEPG